MTPTARHTCIKRSPKVLKRSYLHFTNPQRITQVAESQPVETQPVETQPSPEDDGQRDISSQPDTASEDSSEVVVGMFAEQ